MKFSVNLEIIYKELPFAERFAAAKKDGFDRVEIWDWDSKDLHEVRRLLEENELTLTAMGGDGPYSMCDPAHQEEYLAYIQKSIEAAKIVGCKRLLVHSNELLPEPKQHAADLFPQYSDTVKTLAMFRNLMRMAPLAEEAGITFCLEALNIETDHCGNFLTNTTDAVEITSMVGSAHIKVIFDAYHMFLSEGKTCETLRKYKDSIDYIHIADCPGRHEPGTGIINYRGVFACLQEIGYASDIAFELYPKASSTEAIAAIKASMEGF